MEALVVQTYLHQPFVYSIPAVYRPIDKNLIERMKRVGLIQYYTELLLKYHKELEKFQQYQQLKLTENRRENIDIINL